MREFLELSEQDLEGLDTFLPIIVFVMSFFISMFILFKISDYSLLYILGYSVGISIIMVLSLPFLKKLESYINNKFNIN